MFGMKRIVIAQHERGLYLKDRSIEKILGPGVYWIMSALGRVTVQVFDVTKPEFVHPYQDVLVKERAELTARYFQVIELGEQDVGLVYKNGRLSTVLAPGTRQLYWKGPVEVRVEVLSIAQDYAVSREVSRLIARARPGELAQSVASSVVVAEVAEKFMGLLFVDGELIKTLAPGLYAYWKFNRAIKVEQVDTRLTEMEVSGQEILTKDKVSLRVNLSAQYRVVDLVAARKGLVDMTGYLYRALQFSARQAIGIRVRNAHDGVLLVRGPHDAVRTDDGDTPVIRGLSQ